MAAPVGDASWRDYYEKVAGRPPRELLIQAAERFAAPGLAIDLGCGGGVETQELLRRGWTVLALDGEAAAMETVAAGTPAEYRSRLTTQCAGFSEMALPPADLIWAGLSLPFCPPAEFPGVWARLAAAIRPGGRIAGDLFGPGHAWNDRPNLTFVTREQVQTYLEGFAVERLTESEEERQTAFQGMQRWHGFAVIARKLPAVGESKGAV